MPKYSKRVWNLVLSRDKEIKNLVKQGFEFESNFPWQDGPLDLVMDGDQFFKIADRLEEIGYKTKSSRAYDINGKWLKGMRALWRKSERRFFSVHKNPNTSLGHISELIYVSGHAEPFRYNNGPLCGTSILSVDTFLPARSAKICKNCKRIYSEIPGRKELIRRADRYDKIIGRKRLKFKKPAGRRVE